VLARARQDTAAVASTASWHDRQTAPPAITVGWSGAGGKPGCATTWHMP
jgi:hypothetical protein